MQDADTITAPTKIMKMLYYASILAGEVDEPDSSQDEDIDMNTSEDKTTLRTSQTIQVISKM